MSNLTYKYRGSVSKIEKCLKHPQFPYRVITTLPISQSIPDCASHLQTARLYEKYITIAHRAPGRLCAGFKIAQCLQRYELTCAHNVAQPEVWEGAAVIPLRPESYRAIQSKNQMRPRIELIADELCHELGEDYYVCFITTGCNCDFVQGNVVLFHSLDIEHNSYGMLDFMRNGSSCGCEGVFYLCKDCHNKI